MAAKINIQLTKDQQKALAVAVVLLGLGGFAYVKYFWLPVAARITEARAKIASLSDSISKAQGAASRRDKIQGDLAALRLKTAETEKRLPRVRDVPTVIDLLAKLTRRYKVELGKFSPGNPAQQGLFEEVPYDLSVTGYYHDIGRFLAALAVEERIYNVRGINYSLVGGTDKPGQVGISFTLVAYTYKG